MSRKLMTLLFALMVMRSLLRSNIRESSFYVFLVSQCAVSYGLSVVSVKSYVNVEVL